MKYKLFLVSVLSAAILVGCGSTNESVESYSQDNASSIVAETESKNEITKDNNSEDLADAQSKRTNREERTKEEYNLDTFTINREREEEQVTRNADSSLSNANAQVVIPTPDDGETSETKDSQTVSPNKESINRQCTPEVMIQPTKVPTELLTQDSTSIQELTSIKQLMCGSMILIESIKQPCQTPTIAPTETPTAAPSQIPTAAPTQVPTAAPTQVPTAAPTQVPTATPTPAPTNAPTQPPSSESAKSLSVRGVTIAMGESKSSVIEKLGNPSRTDATEYNYDFMVYNNNYTKFVMIAIENSKVVGWYTDSSDFSYDGLTTSSNVSTINSKYQKSLSLNRTLSVTADGRKLTFFMDTLGDKTIDGILVTTTSVTKDSTTDSVLRAWEKEVFDLTNSFRARNGLSALSWSDSAAKAARLHSKDMADNNYFSHTGLNGSSPSDRLKAQGISFTASGENIIGGYGNALYSSNGWMNSSGHRSNLLHKSFQYLGVGYVLGGSYGNYATQNFYR